MMSSPPQSTSESADRIGFDAVNSLTPTAELAFVTEGQSTTWSDWLESVNRLVDRYRSLRQARAGLLLRPSAESYASLAALSHVGCDVCLLDERIDSAEIRDLADSQSLDAVIDPSRAEGGGGIDPSQDLGRSPRSGQGRVTIFTSGSTGRTSLFVMTGSPSRASPAEIPTSLPLASHLPPAFIRGAPGFLALPAQSRDARGAGIGHAGRSTVGSGGAGRGHLGFRHTLLLAPPDDAGASGRVGKPAPRADHLGGRGGRPRIAGCTPPILSSSPSDPHLCHY